MPRKYTRRLAQTEYNRPGFPAKPRPPKPPPPPPKEHPLVEQICAETMAQVWRNIRNDEPLDFGIDSEEGCRRMGIPIDYEGRRAKR